MRRPRLDVLEHAGLVVVGHLALRGMVDQRLGIGVELDALGARDRLALVDQAAHERAQVGPLADAPVRQARERAERVRGRVEDHLAPLRRARVRDRVRRHAGARAGIGEALDLLGRRAGCGSNGRERRVALDVPLHEPGLEQLARRKGRAADHALDVAGEHLLVADAVHDGRDGTVGEGVRGRGDRRLGVHGLGRDDPELALRQRRGIARRVQAAVHVARAGRAAARLR